MHRNGIQLSGPTAQGHGPRSAPRRVEPRHPVIEIPSLHDRAGALRGLPRGARASRRPGSRRSSTRRATARPARTRVTVRRFGEMYGIGAEVAQLRRRNTRWPSTPRSGFPGSLMSFRDAHAMLRVPVLRERPAGRRGASRRRHEGHATRPRCSANPMLQLSGRRVGGAGAPARAAGPRGRDRRPAAEGHAEPRARRRRTSPRSRCPAPTSAVSPRAGSEAAYDAVAQKYPRQLLLRVVRPRTRRRRSARPRRCVPREPPRSR